MAFLTSEMVTIWWEDLVGASWDISIVTSDQTVCVGASNHSPRNLKIIILMMIVMMMMMIMMGMRMMTMTMMTITMTIVMMTMMMMLDLASTTFWHPLPVPNCGQHHQPVPGVKSFWTGCKMLRTKKITEKTLNLLPSKVLIFSALAKFLHRYIHYIIINDIVDDISNIHPC